MRIDINRHTCISRETVTVNRYSVEDLCTTLKMQGISNLF